MPATAERRSPRKPVSLALLIVVESSGREMEAEALAHDLSEHGIGISSGASLKPGQVVEVRGDEGFGSTVRARVVWVGDPQSDRQSPAGLEFLSPLSKRA